MLPWYFLWFPFDPDLHDITPVLLWLPQLHPGDTFPQETTTQSLCRGLLGAAGESSLWGSQWIAAALFLAIEFCNAEIHSSLRTLQSQWVRWQPVQWLSIILFHVEKWWSARQVQQRTSQEVNSTVVLECLGMCWKASRGSHNPLST